MVNTKTIDIDLIVKGGDERLDLDLCTNLNKYHINPMAFDKVFNRGSCTVNGLSVFGKKVFLNFLENSERLPFEEIRKEHSKRLKSLINFEGEDKFDIIYAPSGSDLIYIPYLFSLIQNPDRPIVNFLTCPEELGSGTIIGAQGKYFMGKNQFGETIAKNDLIQQDIETKVVSFSARDVQGRIVNPKKSLKKAITAHAEYSKIGSLVIGSKSGIENNIDIVAELPGGDEMFWAVDLCQFRNRKELINKLLDLNCMVMITGSKFYQSPPFSGAMLVPKSITQRIKKIKITQLAGFEKVFSAHDFPEPLRNIRVHLNPYENFGLLARWECAIAEMEAYNKIPKNQTSTLLLNWNKLVCSTLWANDEYFELMPNMELTNKSIISFRVKKGESYLDYDQLKLLFKNIVNSPCTGIKYFSSVFIGQPVKYGEKAFLRLAIGSNDIRRLIAKPEETRFEDDKKLIAFLKEKIDQFA